MTAGNRSTVTEFFILGLPAFNSFKVPFFIVILLVYSLTISENVLIILLVSTCHRLRSPMYFFLGHLSLCDIILVTNIVPNLLHIIIREGITMSFSGCFTQYFFHGVSVSTECFLLTVMSYDRYLAICDPLHYISIMDLTFRYSSVTCSWMVSCILALNTMILTYQLDFCGPNIIDHFFCDFSPLLELSCSDTTGLEINMLLISFPIFLSPFLFIIVTYICISVTINKIHSTSGRQKAFSTCSSHLAVVCTYYGSMLTIYMIPSQGQSLIINRFLSLVYIVFTPLLNPVIYSLRNQEIRASLVRYKLLLESYVGGSVEAANVTFNTLATFPLSSVQASSDKWDLAESPCSGNRAQFITGSHSALFNAGRTVRSTLPSSVTHLRARMPDGSRNQNQLLPASPSVGSLVQCTQGTGY
ncbi:olfactory receptor 1J4-like [Pelodytes ibericus]